MPKKRKITIKKLGPVRIKKSPGPSGKALTRKKAVKRAIRKKA